MNKVILIGRLTKDPELRYSQGTEGTAVCKFTLAVDRRKKDEPADFLNIVAFGKTGEVCQKYLGKGRQVGIDGRIQVRSYDNKEGKKVYVTEIIAENIDFVGNRPEQNQKPQEKPQDTFIDDTDTDEDLPWE